MLVSAVSCLGGFHHLLLLTGLGPLGVAAGIWLLGFLWELGSHVALRKEGSLPIRSALLAGLPWVLVIVYIAGT